jgi:lipopolysaccharide transport system permease protein
MSINELAIQPVEAHTEYAAPGYSRPVTVIEPQRGWIPLNLAEIWRYRDLLVLLVRRDFTAQYRQSLFGVGWAFFNPVFTVIVNVIVFSKMAKFPSDGVPYPVFNLAALLPWEYFAGCLSSSSSSVAGSSALLTKVYFPRLILPLGKVLSGLMTFGIRFALLIAMMAWYGITPTWAVVTVPIFLLLSACAALSVGLWLTAIDVKYRDVRRLVPATLRFWMFASPIVYPISLVPEQWRALYSLNPMVGVIEGFRWAMLGKAPPDWTMMGISSGVTLVLLIGGLYFFRRMEGTFADVI